MAVGRFFDGKGWTVWIDGFVAGVAVVVPRQADSDADAGGYKRDAEDYNQHNQPGFLLLFLWAAAIRPPTACRRLVILVGRLIGLLPLLVLRRAALLIVTARPEGALVRGLLRIVWHLIRVVFYVRIVRAVRLLCIRPGAVILVIPFIHCECLLV